MLEFGTMKINVVRVLDEFTQILAVRLLDEFTVEAYKQLVDKAMSAKQNYNIWEIGDRPTNSF